MTSIKLERQYYKVRIPNYYQTVISTWYVVEMLLQARFEMFFGIQKSYLNTVFSFIFLFLLLIKIVFIQHYSKRELARIILFGALVIAVTVRSGFNNTLMSFAIFTIASKNENLDRIINITYRVCLVLIPLIIILSLCGVFENRITYRFGNAAARYSLGFVHANTLGAYVYLLISCHFYLHFQRLKYIDYLLALLAAIFCYVVPNSQSAVIMLVLLPVVTLIYKIGKKLSKENLILYGLLIGALLCNVMSIILSSIDLTRHPFLSLIDTAISFRFSDCHRDMNICGITWFGQRIEVLGTELFENLGISRAHVIITLDNSYCAILLTYGIVMYAVLSWLYLYNMFLQIKKRNIGLVIFLFMTAVYGITERTMLTLSINIFLLCFSEVFYYRKRQISQCTG